MQSVLFSIQVYWSSIFIIPTKVLKDIDKVLRAFLWSGPELKASGAKFSWAYVCSPKAEGGLGFRHLSTWNKAAMSRHIWAICNKADTLWVKWVHTNILKGRCLWRIQVPTEASWTIRKLFKLRDIVQTWITARVGNGQWLDNWHPLGPLFKKFGEAVVQNRGTSLLAKVSSIIHQGVWKWPRVRSPIIQNIIEHTPTTFLPSVDSLDSFVWNLNGRGVFTIKSAWNALRLVRPTVMWAKIVWFSHNVPRWAFIEWLAFWGRLSTKDRLRSWDLQGDTICCLSEA